MLFRSLAYDVDLTVSFYNPAYAPVAHKPFYDALEILLCTEEFCDQTVTVEFYWSIDQESTMVVHFASQPVVRLVEYRGIDSLTSSVMEALWHCLNP